VAVVLASESRVYAETMTSRAAAATAAAWKTVFREVGVPSEPTTTRS
jgi:hypothetical protein